jgi:hypothetical protein
MDTVMNKNFENLRVVGTDRLFVCAGNPDGDGGGVIGSFNVMADAVALKIELIKADYNRVQILTWEEFMGDDNVF